MRDRIKAVQLASEGWSAAMIAHTYHHTHQIVTLVKERFGGQYSVAGMNKWLHHNGFSNKMPKGGPHKFDAVNPTQTTKITHSWIRKGQDQHLETTADLILSERYPLTHKLHIVLDVAGYHRSDLVKDAAFVFNIELHYLPPYSPTLNPIERLWRVMNEKSRNNVYFESKRDFRAAIEQFLL